MEIPLYRDVLPLNTMTLIHLFLFYYTIFKLFLSKQFFNQQIDIMNIIGISSFKESINKTLWLEWL